MFVRGRGRGNRNSSQQNAWAAPASKSWGRSRGEITNGGNGASPGKPGSPKSNSAVCSSSKSVNCLDRDNEEPAGQPGVEELFAKARSEHQQSAQKILGANKDAYEDLSDEEEEDDIGNSVLDGVFKSYANTYDSGNQREVESAQEKLLHSFRSGTSACLVCIESIKKEDSIWSCKGCYCMFHITCIQKWVREGVYTKQYASDELHTSRPSDKIPWQCPKCRHEYSQNECPTHYYCFCGKQRDPKFDPWNVPHSCGGVCGRSLVPSCGHTCLLLCHPGACPPCPAMVKSACHCRASAPRMVRCSAKAWACAKVCGKTLSCLHHECQHKCHPGECQPCTKTSLQNCLCGKHKTQRPCDSVVWQCEQVCGKRFSCGNHVCEKTCHKGDCGDCPRLGPRKCPCGKTKYTLPCTQDVPNCGDTCGKFLSCGEHTCYQRCHKGPCGQCLELTTKKCRCGQKQKPVSCAKEFLCDKKCINMRNCGVHKCNRKCCEGNCPTCEQICGKTMKCRNHKCASPCHRGPCYPCPLTMDISCHCGKTKITVPCGKSTKPPRCSLPCRAPPNCHHPARQKHRCHFDDCPPCRIVCGLPLKGCKHSCPALCHDVVVMRIEDKRVKAGPWEERAPVTKVVCKPCPPCQVPIPTQCFGKHETYNIPCSEMKTLSCGRKCGRQLSCGNHTCERECHTVTGAKDSTSAGKDCAHCERACEVPRPAGCYHPCFKACHPPPCTPCTQRVKTRCHCQKMIKYIECATWVASSEQEKVSLKNCGGDCTKELPCGHLCGEPCHPGDCPNAGKCMHKIFLRCRCKATSKTVVCKDRDPSEKLQCDNCLTVKNKPKSIQDEKRVEEEKKKAEQEMEDFERMMKGRRKKTRKHQVEVMELSLWERYQNLLMACCGVALAAITALVCFWLDVFPL